MLLTKMAGVPGLPLAHWNLTIVSLAVLATNRMLCSLVEPKTIRAERRVARSC